MSRKCPVNVPYIEIELEIELDKDMLSEKTLFFPFPPCGRVAQRGIE